MKIVFPVILDPNGAGGYIARFPDVPQAITEADTKAEALAWAEDALVVALTGYQDAGLDIPAPSRPKPAQPTLALPPYIAIKLVIYQAMRDQNVSQAELARRLGCDPRQVRRLMDLDHRSRLDLMERALAALGKRLLVDVQDAA